MYLFALITFALFGLIFGSFANVVIWRFPRKESLSLPPSHCTHCNTQLKAKDNIPVASYLLLGGKCRYCKKPISPRYVLVEIMSSIAFIIAFMLSSNLVQAVMFALFFYVLLILSYIDIDTQRLPNKIVGFLGVSGLVGVALSYIPTNVIELLTISGQRIASTSYHAHSVLPALATSATSSPIIDALYGVLLSTGPAAIFATLYYFARNKSGFGMGDIKLLAAVGPFLGVYGALTLPVSSFIALIALGIARISNKEISLTHKFAFGPYLALGACLVLVWGAPVWDWYIHLLV